MKTGELRAMYGQQVKARILQTNPELYFSVADLDGYQLWEALDELGHAAREVAHFYGPSAKFEALDFCNGEIVDRVQWMASRDTIVLQVRNGGNNFRVWYWVHADDTATFAEAIVYAESTERTQAEMGAYD